MNYILYLTAWIAFLVTLIAFKLFGMFSGERDFKIAVEGLNPGGKGMMQIGVLDGKYSSNSFHVKAKVSPPPPPPGMPVYDGALMTMGSITGNY